MLFNILKSGLRSKKTHRKQNPVAIRQQLTRVSPCSGERKICKSSFHALQRFAPNYCSSDAGLSNKYFSLERSRWDILKDRICNGQDCFCIWSEVRMPAHLGSNYGPVKQRKTNGCPRSVAHLDILTVCFCSSALSLVALTYDFTTFKHQPKPYTERVKKG